MYFLSMHRDCTTGSASAGGINSRHLWVRMCRPFACMYCQGRRNQLGRELYAVWSTCTS